MFFHCLSGVRSRGGFNLVPGIVGFGRSMGPDCGGCTGPGRVDPNPQAPWGWGLVAGDDGWGDGLGDGQGGGIPSPGLSFYLVGIVPCAAWWLSAGHGAINHRGGGLIRP